MKMAKLIVSTTLIFTIAAFPDVGYVNRHLSSLIQFSQQRQATLLVYDQLDQARGLSVISNGRVVDIPTELRSFAKPNSSQATPSLSPDGGQVAFVQSASGNGAAKQQEIWLFDVRKGEAKKIAQYPHALSVTWSPAGNALAVNTGNGELRVLLLSSLQSKPIATEISSNVASWSPDGRKITYESASGRGDKLDFNVNVVDVGTGRAYKIAKGRYPSWSPHGDLIAYLDERKQRYLSISPGGGESTPLVKGGKKILGDLILSGPVVWSPDERYVVITGYYDGGTSLTLVDLSNSKKTILNQGGYWLLATWK